MHANMKAVKQTSRMHATKKVGPQASKISGNFANKKVGEGSSKLQEYLQLRKHDTKQEKAATRV